VAGGSTVEPCFGLADGKQIECSGESVSATVGIDARHAKKLSGKVRLFFIKVF
jgi:hypothetical protein